MHKNAYMTEIKDRKSAVDKALSDIDSDFVKALAEPARMEILKQLIVLGSSDVKTLAELMPQDRSVISRHLSLMEKAGILSALKQGRHVVYQVDGSSTLQKSEQLVASIRVCLSLGCC